jgi:hypothetical protein
MLVAHFPKIGELPVEPQRRLTISLVGFLRGVEHAEIVAMALKCYAGRPPIRPNLRRTFEPGSVVAVHPSVQHVLRVGANPKIDFSVVARISVNVIHFERIAGPQVRDPTGEPYVPLPPVPICICEGDSRRYVPNTFRRLVSAPRQIPNPRIIVDVDQEFYTAAGGQFDVCWFWGHSLLLVEIRLAGGISPLTPLFY